MEICRGTDRRRTEEFNCLLPPKSLSRNTSLNLGRDVSIADWSHSPLRQLFVCIFIFLLLVENDITVPAYCFRWCLLSNRRTITFVLIHNVALYWSVLLNSDPDQNFLAVSFGFHHNLLFLFKISLSSESKKVKKTHHLCSRRVEHHLLPKFESF